MARHQPVDPDSLSDPDYTPPGSAELSDMAKRHAHLLQQFWQQWQTEYLTALREVHTQHGKQSSAPVLGDIVLIHDNSPRATWKIAEVTGLCPGSDGVIRSVQIRTPTGLITTRPVSKLYPLEVTRDRDPEDETPTLAPPDSAPPVTSQPQSRPRRTAAANADAINRVLLEDD